VSRKQAVRRFVDEAVNGGRLDVVEELFVPDLRESVRDWFGAFRGSFPDMRMELVELVAEDRVVVGRFACSATHTGEWRGHAPTGRRFERVDEVYFFRSPAIASLRSGGSRTRSSATVNLGSTRPPDDRHMAAARSQGCAGRLALSRSR
jgi:predicted ester cyclase